MFTFVSRCGNSLNTCAPDSNVYNFSLGSKSETKNIFIDKSNHGNSSLEKTMMGLSKHSKYEVEKIKVLSVQSFFNSIKKKYKREKVNY